MAEVYCRGAVVRLQRDAIWVAVTAGPRHGLDPGALGGSHQPHDADVGLYAPNGRLAEGRGPVVSQVAGLPGGLVEAVESGRDRLVVPAEGRGRGVPGPGAVLEPPRRPGRAMRPSVAWSTSTMRPAP
jgi:hypothetical protein